MEEIQQLQRRLNEQILERAEADPQWRRQYIKDPQTATGGIPEARQLQEMLERARPAEQLPQATMPITAQEEYRQVHRSVTEKVLDKAASDPAWKQQLLNDPDEAIREASFPEVEQLEEIRQSVAASPEEVEAHGVLPGGVGGSMEPVFSGAQTGNPPTYAPRSTYCYYTNCPACHNLTY